MGNSEIKKLSKENLKGNWLKFVLVTLVVFILTGIPEIIFNESNISIANNVLTFIISVLTGVFSINLYLNLVRNGKFDINNITKDFKVYLRYAGFSLILGIVVVVITIILISIFIGSIFSITFFEYEISYVIFSLILVAVLLSLMMLIINIFFLPVEYLIVDGFTLSESLSKSFSLMKGNKWRFFKFQLSFLGWMILGILTLGIGLLWVIPYYSTSLANFYLIIRNEKDSCEKFDLNA